MNGGVLKQTARPIDVTGVEPEKAMLAGLSGSPDEILAWGRIDDGVRGELWRMMVGLYTDPRTGRGYNFGVTARSGSPSVQFLNDMVAWSGPLTGSAVLIVTGSWYWFHFKVDMSTAAQAHPPG